MYAKDDKAEEPRRAIHQQAAEIPAEEKEKVSEVWRLAFYKMD